MPLRFPPLLHRWNLTPGQAIAVQRRLAGRIVLRSPGGHLRRIAGLDAAFADGGRTCVAAVVLWDADEQVVLEQHLARRPVRFPYVPGLLSFREAPALLAALRRLSQPPDALMCDGHGLAHPRRFGIACHLGLLCDLPSVGCAKSVLVGSPGVPAAEAGSVARLIDRGEVLADVLRTRPGGRPVYVSPGHRMDQSGSTVLVRRCVTRYRLPEPTRLADRLVARARVAPGFLR